MKADLISDISAAGILDSCRRIVQIVHTASKSTEKAVGMSSAQLFVLQKLSAAESLSIKDLAALTHTHQSSVSVVAKKLLEKAYIATVPCPEDQRKTLLKITASGKKVVQKNSGAQVQDRLLDSAMKLSEKERELLDHLLSELVKGLNDSEHEVAMFLED